MSVSVTIRLDDESSHGDRSFSLEHFLPVGLRAFAGVLAEEGGYMKLHVFWE